jgi:hypothetical protein
VHIRSEGLLDICRRSGLSTRDLHDPVFTVDVESGARSLGEFLSGLDDCSRFCVIAKVVRRATGRAVCRAFVAAMAAYGIPDEA